MRMTCSLVKGLLILFAAMLLALPALAGNNPEVEVSTDKKEYMEGEPLTITLIPKQNCNVVLLYVTAAGDTIRILPSGTGPDGTLKGKQVYKTPSAGEDRGLYISDPFGKEQIIVYATTAPLPSIQGEEIGDGLFLIPGGEKEVDHLLPDAFKSIWNLETFSKGERGRFRKSSPESPIDMTGSAGRDAKVKEEGLK